MYKYLVLLLLLSCCKANDTEAPIANEASAYIDEVIAVLQENSVNRSKIDWRSFRVKVLAKAGKAKTITDTYPAIHYAIKLLGDGHSYFAPNITDETVDDGEPPLLADEIVPDDIGYIRVRYCMGNVLQKQAFTEALLDDIKNRDKKSLKGWIVDLRGNFGGDMTPMLLGIGPILGNGILGYTSYPDGNNISWKYDQGNLYYENVQDTDIKTRKQYGLKTSDPYVAVVTDTLTASSGEAVTVAFKGREKTKSFGYRTYGVPTSNQKFQLSDGSNMLITVAVFTDRDKNSYNGPIYPDKEIDPDKALDEAIKWLRVQNAGR